MRKSSKNSSNQVKINASPICFRKKPLRVAICTALASPLLYGGAVTAQEGATVIDEIIVTSRKRAESIMDVPVSISAMSGQALNDSGVSSLTDLFAMMPGVENNADSSRSGNKPNIRGVGTTANASLRSKVTSFLDGVPFVGAAGVGSFAGLDRVEVLRGPQSAAFGRATFGGAINYVSLDPSDEFDFNVSANFGSEETRELVGTLSTPIIEDKLAMIVTLQEKNYGGADEWVTTSGDQLGEENMVAGSIKFAFTPTDNIVAKLMYMSTDVDDSSAPVLIADPSQLVPHPDAAGGVCGPPTCVFVGEIPTVPQVYDFDYDNPANPIDNPGLDLERERTYGSLDIALDSGYSISFVAAYTDEQSQSFYDRDKSNAANGGSYTLHIRDTPNMTENYGEVRLESPAEDRFSWLIGASIYDYEYENFVYQNGALMNAFAEDADNRGVFFNLNYDFNDRLTGSLEGRYQSDEIIGDNSAGLTPSSTTDSFQPRLSLTYALNDENNIYFQAAKGNNPAGFNMTAFAPATQAQAAASGFDLPVYETYREEELINLEVGLKGGSAEHNFRYSAAIYHMDLEGYVEPVTLDIDALGNTVRVFTNAGDMDGMGFEFEGVWSPTENLVIGGMYSYNGLEFNESSCTPILLEFGVPATQTAPFACVATPGATPGLVSKHTAAANATYSFPVLGQYDGFARVDYQYRSKRYLEQSNTGWFAPSDVVNFRVGFKEENWSAELYALNLFDETSPAGGVRYFDNTLPGMARSAHYSPRRPRTIGIRLSYSL